MRSQVLAAAAFLPLVVGACASRSDVDALNSQVASLRAQVDAVDRKATQAQAQSTTAMSDAAIARTQSEAAVMKVHAGPQKTTSK